jgi:hypothetical protein
VKLSASRRSFGALTALSGGDDESLFDFMKNSGKVEKRACAQ